MPGPAFLAETIDATAAIDAVLAEPFAWTPMMRAADSRADIADPGRVAATVNSIYLDKPAKPEMADSYDRRQQRRPGLESGTPRLKISPNEIAAQLAANASFSIKSADQFLRLSDGSAWRVSSAEPLAGGALMCNVNRLG